MIEGDTSGSRSVLLAPPIAPKNRESQLRARSVILDAGQVVADGPTIDLLADTARLASNRLELPVGATYRRTVDIA